MIDSLLKFLRGAPPETLEAGDDRLAMAALMVRLARADGSYLPVEQAAIDTMLSGHFNLFPDAATALRQQAETVEQVAPDNVQFTRRVKEAVPFEGREEVVEMLWAVVLSDGRRDHSEDALMRLFASLLGVNDRNSALARQRAQAQLYP